MRETGRHTDRQADRNPDIETFSIKKGHAYRQTERQTETSSHTDIQAGRQKYR